MKVAPSDFRIVNSDWINIDKNQCKYPKSGDEVKSKDALIAVDFHHEAYDLLNVIEKFGPFGKYIIIYIFKPI